MSKFLFPKTLQALCLCNNIMIFDSSKPKNAIQCFNSVFSGVLVGIG